MPKPRQLFLTPIYISFFFFFNSFFKVYKSLCIFQTVAHKPLGLRETVVLSGSVSLIPRSCWFRAWVGFLFLKDKTYVTRSYRTSVHCKRADLASSTEGDWVWTLCLPLRGSLIRLLITRLRDRALSRPRMRTARSCCECFVAGLKLLVSFGRSSRDFGSGVVCTPESKEQRCAVFTHNQERVQDHPSFRQDAGNSFYDRRVQDWFHEEKWQLRSEEVR